MTGIMGTHLTPRDLVPRLQPGNAMSWRLCLPLEFSLSGKPACLGRSRSRTESPGKVYYLIRAEARQSLEFSAFPGGAREREFPPVSSVVKVISPFEGEGQGEGGLIMEPLLRQIKSGVSAVFPAHFHQTWRWQPGGRPAWRLNRNSERQTNENK